jgi:hypothetical protein
MDLNHPNHPARQSSRCLLCSNPKDKDILICWPCHRQQKNDYDGGYSPELVNLLEVIGDTTA